MLAPRRARALSVVVRAASLVSAAAAAAAASRVRLASDGAQQQMAATPAPTVADRAEGAYFGMM